MKNEKHVKHEFNGTGGFNVNYLLLLLLGKGKAGHETNPSLLITFAILLFLHSPGYIYATAPYLLFFPFPSLPLPPP